jgi:hypothetical protein
VDFMGQPKAERNAMAFDKYLSYIPLPHNICFTNAANTLLFCGEDLNFGAFSKYFPLGCL